MGGSSMHLLYSPWGVCRVESTAFYTKGGKDKLELEIKRHALDWLQSLHQFQEMARLGLKY